MSKNFLPAKEGALLSWAQSFSAFLTADPTNFGCTIEEAASIEAATTAFAASYAVVQDPVTRSPANIETKNDDKKALVALIRPLVKRIQGWEGITNAKRAKLQINIPDVDPTPVPVPETAPVIQFESVVGNRVTLRLRDADSTRRGRPAYVTGATVFSYVGNTAPGDISAWKFEGNIKDTVTIIDIPSTVAPGSKVFFTGFWRNNRDESGPAAAPVSTNVQGGSVSNMAA
ncbi:hypothetical protein OT109_01720 [Phycisphaeraceae bacterium D3-23]